MNFLMGQISHESNSIAAGLTDEALAVSDWTLESVLTIVNGDCMTG